MSTNAVVTSRVRAAGRLAINKLQIVQQKEAALAKQNRRQLSQTMAAGKVASARIRAETVIAQDVYVELLELLELYCELVVSRAGLLEPSLSRDPRLTEAVHTIVHAGIAADVKELQALRDLLLHILAKEVSTEALENNRKLVPEQVLKRVNAEVPSEELVNLYLSEIAKAYKVNVPGIYELKDEPVEQEVTEGATATGTKSETSDAKPAGKPPSETDALWERFNNLKK